MGTTGHGVLSVALVIASLLGHATWHAYREMVG